MKKREKLIINDKYIYLKNQKYKTKYINQGKINDYNNAKIEIESILKENKLNKSIFKNKLNIIISNSLNSCEEFVIKSIFEELQINDLEILKLNDCLFDKIETNNAIIYNYEDYLELFAFDRSFIIDIKFKDSIYNYLKENKIKKIFILSQQKDVDSFIKSLENIKNLNIYYNKNYIMQLFQ